jgi:two-component system sensor histidine kinase/response regulator
MVDPRSPTPDPRFPIKVLIVEDSPTQAEQLKYILERQNYHVLTARNGIEALACMRQSRPTLVISDIIMPEMDGYQLCRQIKADLSLKDIPVILLTALSDPQDVIKGLECGADNFLTKPFDEKYLLYRIQHILDNLEFRDRESMQMGVEISFRGQKYFITADRLQILNLLLSTYEVAIQKNLELSGMQRQLRELNEGLEKKVEERTAALREEMVERKRAEEAVRRLNQELEQRVVERTLQLEATNKELEAFSYSVSHDLQAPLRAIEGFSHILLEDYDEKLDEEGRGVLNRIGQNTKKMKELIDDLLALSRLGRREIKASTVNMESLARNVFNELKPAVPDRILALDIGTLPPSEGDPSMIRQVFVNLLLNAIKFTRTRETARIEVGSVSKKNEIAYFVKDNGVGFDMDYASKLFAPFQRLHSIAEFEGTGVGLAIVQRIIHRHGGRVWAEGKVNEGATFYFTLPRETEKGDKG